MLYENLIEVSKVYIGPVAPSFVDSILRILKLDKDAIDQSNILAIADEAYKRTKNYTTLVNPIHDAIKKDILAIK
jgi:hypothetical protein